MIQSRNPKKALKQNLHVELWVQCFTQSTKSSSSFFLSLCFSLSLSLFQCTLITFSASTPCWALRIQTWRCQYQDLQNHPPDDFCLCEKAPLLKLLVTLISFKNKPLNIINQLLKMMNWYPLVRKKCLLSSENKLTWYIFGFSPEKQFVLQVTNLWSSQFINPNSRHFIFFIFLTLKSQAWVGAFLGSEWHGKHGLSNLIPATFQLRVSSRLPAGLPQLATSF